MAKGVKHQFLVASPAEMLSTFLRACKHILHAKIEELMWS